MPTARWCAVVAALLLLSSSFPRSAAQAGLIHEAAKAGDVKEVERLIAAGTSVDERDSADKTALHWAVDAGQAVVVQLLVERGADVNARDFNGLAVLSVAALAGDEATVELLIVEEPTSTMARASTSHRWTMRLAWATRVSSIYSSATEADAGRTPSIPVRR